MSVLIMLSYAPCKATTIVAIRTPDVFAIAADSAGTFKGGNKPTNERKVSKIFQKNGVTYAIGGLTKDPARGFDPEKVIDDSLTHHKSIYPTVHSVKVLISESLKHELLRLQKEEPVLFREAIESPNAGTSVLMASLENGQPIAIGIQFLGVMNSDGQIVIRTTSLACPGDCPDGVYTFFLGHHKAIDNYVAEHGKHFRMAPEEGVRFLVQLEIDAKTPGVGPPIDVAIIDKNGFRWISRKDPDSTETR